LSSLNIGSLHLFLKWFANINQNKFSIKIVHSGLYIIDSIGFRAFFYKIPVERTFYSNIGIFSLIGKFEILRIFKLRI
jgi:hypothetical protein